MTTPRFIHLNTHSAYSLAQGAIPVKKLQKLATDNNMPALAITDSNNMFGALEFSLEMSKSGIQPIIGAKVHITAVDASKYDIAPEPDILVLLAKDYQGYLNIMEIISRTYTDSEKGITPQISLENVCSLAQGVICLTAASQGALNRLIFQGQIDKAEELIDTLYKHFGDNLYIELQRHGLPMEQQAEPVLLDWAISKNIPIVATNNVHFTEKEMYEAHDVLLCIAQGVVSDVQDRHRLNPEYYFKSEQEMCDLFSDLPEATQNTIHIAQRCAYKTEVIDPLLPQYPYLEGRTEIQALTQLSRDGLKERLENAVFASTMDDKEKNTLSDTYNDRMTYELGIIESMGFPGYFLIVADFIQWSKDNEIPVGPGRGSGAGSIVAWALKITNLDPIRFGLLFERFLNPERISMPDFDIDFCQDRRDEVIHYVQQQYGVDKVAQIITFGKLSARAVIKDVGRVLSVPYGQVDKLSKLIPNNPADPKTIAESIEAVEEIRAEIKEDPTIKHLIEIAQQLEGLYRHASTHAAGVVIGDRPLNKLVPLYMDAKSDMPVTQFNMKFVEQAGLVKFDFLGLKTLTIIQMAVDLVNKRQDTSAPINIDNIVLDDEKTYKMLAKGDTVGVFQLESAGMRKVLMDMKPDRLEDIIAVVALYRPGPMENIPVYVERKHGRSVTEYLHPALEEVLKETFGIPVYQEQVMQMAQVLAGYTLGSADILRRAMGKKIQSEMDAQRKIFKEGSAKIHNVDEKLADAIFDQINAFAGYGFNKSHAAAYALVAYQTAWLKANYPVEFMAATMTYDMTNTDKLQIFKEDLKKSNIPMLLPNVNSSKDIFTVENVTNENGEKQSAVRYALCALKNVGREAVANLVRERMENGNFESIYDVFDRVGHKDLNKRMAESLVKSGAFDTLQNNRKQLFESLEALLKYGAVTDAEKNSAQDSLFGEAIESMSRPVLKKTGLYSEVEKLDLEFDAVGFYLSAHPLETYKNKFKKMDVIEFSNVAKSRDSIVNLAGVIGSVRFLQTKTGKAMAIAECTDATGAFTVLFFEEVLKTVKPLLVAGKTVIVKCSKSLRSGEDSAEVRLTGLSVQDLNESVSNIAAGMDIHIYNPICLQDIATVLEKYGTAGKGAIHIIFNDVIDAEMHMVEMVIPKKYTVTTQLKKALKSLEGITDIKDI